MRGEPHLSRQPARTIIILRPARNGGPSPCTGQKHSAWRCVAYPASPGRTTARTLARLIVARARQSNAPRALVIGWKRHQPNTMPPGCPPCFPLPGRTGQKRGPFPLHRPEAQRLAVCSLSGQPRADNSAYPGAFDCRKSATIKRPTRFGDRLEKAPAEHHAARLSSLLSTPRQNRPETGALPLAPARSTDQERAQGAGGGSEEQTRPHPVTAQRQGRGWTQEQRHRSPSKPPARSAAQQQEQPRNPRTRG